MSNLDKNGEQTSCFENKVKTIANSKTSDMNS